jgi:hypothetical protein
MRGKKLAGFDLERVRDAVINFVAQPAHDI